MEMGTGGSKLLARANSGVPGALAEAAERLGDEGGGVEMGDWEREMDVVCVCTDLESSSSARCFISGEECGQMLRWRRSVVL